ncbi:MAG: DUF3467 domain-containing protein [Planctomycetaceae bacterium]
MSDEAPQWQPDEPDDDLSGPIQGRVVHSNQSARVPTGVGEGHFSNGAIILGGQHEFLFDFLLRIGELQRVVARVILPRQVAEQFRDALGKNLANYHRVFGAIPRPPRPRPGAMEEIDEADSETDNDFDSQHPESHESGSHEPFEGIAGAGLPISNSDDDEAGGRRQRDQPNVPSIDDIYMDLKFPDELLAGKYANAVLIRHSNTEFCFDFIASAYPRSAVSCRLFMASPQVPPLLESLTRSLSTPNDPRLDGDDEG